MDLLSKKAKRVLMKLVSCKPNNHIPDIGNMVQLLTKLFFMA